MAVRWAALVALLALCASWTQLAAAQMESPLKGQGVPGLNTTQIFLSIRIERLLDVDDYKFRHENVATYWLSWSDPTAEAAIRERTAGLAAAGGPAGCRRPCSNRVADVRCCDSIFLPSLYFANADAFPEDREIGYNIDTTSSRAVVWEATVHGLFYQPLSMRNYPVDSFNLETQLTLTDTSRLVAEHPGLQLVPSAASIEGIHFARTKSDLTNGFVVFRYAAFQLYRVNRSAWHQGHMMIEPHAQDVAPITTLNASTSGLLDDTMQMAVFRYQVRRSFWSGRINTIYPVLAVAILSIIVFWIPEEELASRVELCAALFLTLIAIQFVVSDRAVTRNDYLTPPQTLILVTGCYILAFACESVACYYICNWNMFKQRRKDMWQAVKERRRQRKEAKAAGAAANATQDGADEEEVVKPHDASLCEENAASDSDGKPCEEAATEAKTQKKICGCMRCKTRQKVQLPPRSDDYNKFIAWALNKACFVFAVLSYIVVAFLVASVSYGEVFRSKDALLSFSELSSCTLPGVLPGLADPCPAAPLGVSEL